MDVTLEGVVTRHFQGDKGRHWLRFVDDVGEYAFESDTVDLGGVPFATRVKVIARVSGAVYAADKGVKQVLRIEELKFSRV